MKRKSISLLLTAALIMSMAACGSSTTKDSSAGSAETETSGEENADSADAEADADGEEGADADADAPETVTISCLDGASEAVEVTVPYDPQRIVVVDMASLDILDNLGLGDRVVGSCTTALDYLQDYVNNDDIEMLGSIKEVDMETVMACEPDIIFMGGRMAESFDALSEIAPTVRLTTDTELGLLESVHKNAMTIASIFGMEDKVDATMEDFQNRIEALQAVAEGKTAVVGMCTSGSFNVLGNDGRCSTIAVECGFENVGVEVAASESGSGRSGGGRGENAEASEGGEGSGRGGSEDAAEGEEGSGRGGNGEAAEGNESNAESGRSGRGENSEGGEGQSAGATATHGNEASFEYIVSLNPDYIFVMDRDAAIGTEGAKLAPEIMENELIMGTDAYKNGNIVYLEHPGVWYTAEGGITAFDVMLADLESVLLEK